MSDIHESIAAQHTRAGSIAADAEKENVDIEKATTGGEPAAAGSGDIAPDTPASPRSVHGFAVGIPDLPL